MALKHKALFWKTCETRLVTFVKLMIVVKNDKHVFCIRAGGQLVPVRVLVAAGGVRGVETLAPQHAARLARLDEARLQQLMNPIHVSYSLLHRPAPSAPLGLVVMLGVEGRIPPMVLLLPV